MAVAPHLRSWLEQWKRDGLRLNVFSFDCVSDAETKHGLVTALVDLNNTDV